MYHKKNVDFAYLLWEDFVYQVENKNVKRINEMYYPRFTKVIVNFFMTKDPSIPRRNRVNCVKKKKVGSNKTKTHPTAKGKRLKTSAKVAKPAKKKQPAKTSKAKGLTVLSEQISWKSNDEEDDYDDNDNDEDNDDDDNDDDDNDDDDNDDVDDDIDIQDDDGQDDNGQEYDGQDDEGQDDDNEKTDSDNDGDKFVHPKFSTHDQKEILDEEDNEEEEELDEEETNEEDEANELYRDVNMFQLLLLLRHLFRPANNTFASTYTIPLITHLQQTPVPTPKTIPTVSSILGIVDTYLANKMNEAVKTAVQLQSDRLRDEAQADNEDFINKLDDNINKIIKEQVKEQVKAQVSKILLKIEKNTANLSELELKNIIIDKMESNKCPIHRLMNKRNVLQQSIVLTPTKVTNSYLIHDGDTDSFKSTTEMMRINDEEPSVGSNRSIKGSKSHHKSPDKSTQAEEPMHIAEDLEEPAHQEFDTRFTKDQPVDETTQHHDWI
ncbi:hypothetical protein Tco_0663140 [Tanacetum coccineum]